MENDRILSEMMLVAYYFALIYYTYRGICTIFIEEEKSIFTVSL